MATYQATSSDIRLDDEATPGNQAGVQLARLPGGRFVATWATIDTDAVNSVTFVQVFDASGNKVGPEGSFTGGEYQTRPAVASLTGGGFVLVWKGHEGDPGFYSAQTFDADGVAVGDLITGLASADPFAAGPQVIGFPDGGFVIGFEDADFSIKVQRYSLNGETIGSPGFLAPAGGSFDVAAIPSGFVIVSSQFNFETKATEVIAQLVGIDGTPGAMITVSSDPSKQAISPQVTGLATGGFAVSWSYSLEDGAIAAVALFDASGAKVGSEVTLSSDRPLLSGTSIAALENGEFVVSYGDQDGKLFVQAFSAEGTKVGTPFLADNNQDGSQFDGDIVGLSGGGFTVAWDKNNNEVGARIFMVSAAPANNAPTLTGLASAVTLDENRDPQLLDSDVAFNDADENFDGGSLVLSGLLAEDRAAIRNEGTEAGQIGVSGSSVTFGGVAIGTVTGGVGETLTVALNASATSAAVDALIQNLTYANASDAPTGSRNLLLNVTDAAGAGVGSGQTITVNVNAVNDAPLLSQSSSAAVTFTENGEPLALLQGGTLVDPDSSLNFNFAGGSLEVSVTGTDNSLTLPNADGFEIVGAALFYSGNKLADLSSTANAITLSNLTSFATPAVMNLLIDNFRYQATGENPSTTDRTVTFTFNDGGNNGPAERRPGASHRLFR
jgi:hypothetical protein